MNQHRAPVAQVGTCGSEDLVSPEGNLTFIPEAVGSLWRLPAGSFPLSVMDSCRAERPSPAGLLPFLVGTEALHLLELMSLQVSFPGPTLSSLINLFVLMGVSGWRWRGSPGSPGLRLSGMTSGLPHVSSFRARRGAGAFPGVHASSDQPSGETI